MDWKRIKTIFILTFLLLDIFLVVQLKEEITDNHQFKPMVSESDVEILKDIKYDNGVKIPKVDEKFTFISAKNTDLSNENFADLKEKITVGETVGDSIHVKLNEPYPISLLTNSRDELATQLTSFLQEYVLYGKEYKSWSVSEDGQTIIFNQFYNNRPIFFDYSKIPNGIVVLELNKKGEITGYKQTYLLISKQGNSQKIIPAEEALIKLFNYGYVTHDSVVEDIDLGYYSLISIENIQVFSPNWNIQVNGESYMVNAIDGTVTELKETE